MAFQGTSSRLVGGSVSAYHFGRFQSHIVRAHIHQPLEHQSRASLNAFESGLYSLSSMKYSTSTGNTDAHRNDDEGGKTYVISTISRGIGLGFAKQLLNKINNGAASQVIGFVRAQDSSQLPPDLSSLQKEYGYNRLRIIYDVDLQNEDSVDKAVNKVKDLCSSIDILFNVAGILGDGKTTPGPERSITQIDRKWLTETMDINVISHVQVTSGLIPLLKRKKDGLPSKIVNLSARVGSISDNGLGGWFSYRMSKSALNQFTKTLSIEMKRFNCICISIHPGTTDTDLSVPFQKNVKMDKLFSVEYSCQSMLNVVNGLTQENNGKFYDYAGDEIDW